MIFMVVVLCTGLLVYAFVMFLSYRMIMNEDRDKVKKYEKDIEELEAELHILSKKCSELSDGVKHDEIEYGRIWNLNNAVMDPNTSRKYILNNIRSEIASFPPRTPTQERIK